MKTHNGDLRTVITIECLGIERAYAQTILQFDCTDCKEAHVWLEVHKIKHDIEQTLGAWFAPNGPGRPC